MTLLSVIVTGCSSADTPSTPTAATSSSSRAGQTTVPPTYSWSSKDPSCAAPQRVTSAAVPKALRDPELAAGAAASRWLGKEGLWVDPPSVAQVPGNRVKFGSVTLDAKARPTDAGGPPDVSAKRVDGGGNVNGDVGGYAEEASDAPPKSFWPTTIDFPAPGCWRVTVATSKARLHFLMSVKS